MFTRAKIAVAGIAVAVLPVGIAASGSADPSPSSSTADRSSPAGASTSSASATSGAGTTGGAPHVDKPIALHLDGGKIEPRSLPNSSTLFTPGELKPIVPRLTNARADDDTLALTITGESSDNRSHLVIDVPHSGTWKDVEGAWKQDEARHRARSQANPGLYTFFDAGAHGVSASFTDGTTTYALLHMGDAAAVIRFSGIGFSATADTHEASRHTYRTKTVPALLDLVGEKLRAGASTKDASSGPSATDTPTPEASASSTQSAASSAPPAS